MALIDKASLLMVPSTYEAGTLYNVLPSGNRAPDSTDQNSGYDQTRADFTFDRGSNAAATRVNADGLIEKYRENLLTYSNDFLNAAWTKVNASLTSGQADKDGGTDAWKISSSASGSSQIFMSGSNTNMKTHSIYAKAGSVSVLKIWVGSNKEFDLSNGTTSSTNSKITDVGNGWYRCEVFDVFSNYNPFFTATAAGDYIYIQNAQLESGLVATDYLDSGATTAKAGVLIDLPRINYDANGENGALLLEPQRANLVQYSEYFGASSWNKTRATINDNVSISPEGVQNAAKIISTAVNNSHYIRHDVSSTTGVCYVFAKADDFTFLKLATNAHSFSPSFFNLTNGEVTKSALYDAEIEPYGNGWYKCIIKPTDAFTQFFVENAGDSASATHMGDGVKGVFIYGAQVEAGSYSTSYIPNHGESGGVTRAADVCNKTGITDLIGQTEGTMFIECEAPNFNPNPNATILSTTLSITNAISIIFKNNKRFLYSVWHNSTRSDIESSSTYEIGDRVKIAMRYSSSGIKLFINGQAEGTNTDAISFSGALSELKVLDVVSVYYGFPHKNTTKQVIVFKTPLTDAECISLTS